MKPQDAWMWRDEDSGGTMGATVDYDERKILWFDQPGCACGGADGEQAIADFLARGTRALTVPDDVEAEMRAVLADYA